MKRGECEGEAFGVELTTVIGEREGGVRGQCEAVGGGSLWAPAGSGFGGAVVRIGCLWSA
jgi:hypothetical protein